MTAIIAGLISFLPEVPGLINTIEKLIARGKKTGELSTTDADALTMLAQGQFAKYSSPAPPPPGVS
jgi:hypothetical protein